MVAITLASQEVTITKTPMGFDMWIEVHMDGKTPDFTWCGVYDNPHEAVKDALHLLRLRQNKARD